MGPLTPTGRRRPCPRSFYVAAQSMPSLGQYFFVYKVSITNTGAEIVQLRNRHWLIRDAQGQTEHVRCALSPVRGLQQCWLPWRMLVLILLLLGLTLGPTTLLCSGRAFVQPCSWH
jgi:hypothetical protein